MKTQKLLSITIPTWNRAESLDKSLKLLLPQLQSFQNEIELIISDNFSSDNTIEVIKKHIIENKNLDIIPFYQKENTGYFGNFKKCKELASGKYFWLLSDDEHIQNDTLNILINQINSELQVGAYFLNNISSKKNIKNNLAIENSNVKDFFKRDLAYKITLISSVVMLNNKEFEKSVTNMYKENTFLGFLFLINSLRKSSKITILRGTFYLSEISSVSFNIFQSWTKDIMQAVIYSEENKVFDSELRISFVESFLKNVVRIHVLRHQIKGSLFGVSYGTSTELKAKLDKYYKEYDYYKKNIIPLFFMPTIVLIILLICFTHVC